ncbi:hypothetical protein HanIR_Chr06g0265841 [Helianthus annuus]|nr:hypothetical protein HanIR_Chr06g0265841 [Helianthus annuus]
MLKYVWDPRKRITRITLAYRYECISIRISMKRMNISKNMKRISIGISIKRNVMNMSVSGSTNTNDCVYSIN